MKRYKAVALALLVLLAATGYGQWVEDSIDVGKAWVGSLAYNPLMDVVYGVSEKGVFFAIDCATNRVIESWPDVGASKVTYNSTDHKFYFIAGDAILVGDGRTHQVIKTIPLEGATVPVWDSVQNRLYVSCRDRNRVAVFDCAQDTLICEIPVGRYPIKMYLNSRHQKLYVLNEDETSVSVIDLWTCKVITKIRVHIGSQISSACYHAAADKFYCDGGPSGVVVIDGVGDSVMGRIALPARNWVESMIAVEDLGLVLVGVSGSTIRGEVFAIDVLTDSVVSRVTVGRYPRRLWASRKSGRTYCANAYSKDVSVLSYDGSRLYETLEVQDAPFEFAYSPRSRRLYVSHLNSRQVYVIRDQAGGVEQLPELRARVRATVAAGRLHVEEAGLLLDVSGRKVAELEEGEYDLGPLPAGVYIVTTRQGVSGRVVKVR